MRETEEMQSIGILALTKNGLYAVENKVQTSLFKINKEIMKEQKP